RHAVGWAHTLEQLADAIRQRLHASLYPFVVFSKLGHTCRAPSFCVGLCERPGEEDHDPTGRRIVVFLPIGPTGGRGVGPNFTNSGFFGGGSLDSESARLSS